MRITNTTSGPITITFADGQAYAIKAGDNLYLDDHAVVHLGDSQATLDNLGNGHLIVSNSDGSTWSGVPIPTLLTVYPTTPVHIVDALVDVEFTLQPNVNVNGIPTTTGQKTAVNSASVVSASDDPLVVAVGSKADAPAGSDTSADTLMSKVTRLLQGVSAALTSLTGISTAIGTTNTNTAATTTALGTTNTNTAATATALGTANTALAALNTNIGAKADAPAGSDTSADTLMSKFTRLLQGVTTGLASLTGITTAIGTTNTNTAATTTALGTSNTNTAATTTALGTLNTNIGAKADAAATDSASAWSEIALLKGLYARLTPAATYTAVASGATVQIAINNRKATISAIPGAGGTLSLQYSTTPTAMSSPGTANWFPWPAGMVNSNTMDSLLSPVVAIQATAGVAAGVVEVVQ